MVEQFNEEFNAFYKEYYKKLVNHAYRLTSNRWDAEELADEALMIYFHKSQSEIIQNPRAYLKRIMSNVLGNYFKSKKREQVISLEMLHEIPGKDCFMPSLGDCLPAGLTASEREILILRVEKKLSYAEISIELGLEEASCRSRLFRAKMRCKELMETEKNKY